MLWLSVGPTGSALNNCSKQWERANKRFSTLRRHRTRKVFYHGEDTQWFDEGLYCPYDHHDPTVLCAAHKGWREKTKGGILDCSSTQYTHKERGQFVISLSFHSGIHARRWWLRSTQKSESWTAIQIYIHIRACKQGEEASAIFTFGWAIAEKKKKKRWTLLWKLFRESSSLGLLWKRKMKEGGGKLLWERRERKSVFSLSAWRKRSFGPIINASPSAPGWIASQGTKKKSATTSNHDGCLCCHVSWEGKERELLLAQIDYGFPPPLHQAEQTLYLVVAFQRH